MLRGGAMVDARPSDALNLAAITGAPVAVDVRPPDLRRSQDRPAPGRRPWPPGQRSRPGTALIAERA